jgi:hypothetical protein
VKLPPTRNHRQLAAWINTRGLVDVHGRPVLARVERVKTSTDSRVAGTRFRRIGKGRQGLLLEIWPVGASRFLVGERLFRHESSEAYRRHDEARVWVEQNLRKARP